MGIFDKTSNVQSIYKEIARKLALTLEAKFNTKVYDYGVAAKGSPDFEALTPFAIVPPNNAKYIFYFLIPIDDADNIITNDYYEKAEKANSGGMFGFGGHEFSSILRSDWDLSNFLQSQIHSTVYDTGSLKVEKYSGGENIVPNADKIDDLRYRFFRFFSSE